MSGAMTLWDVDPGLARREEHGLRGLERLIFVITLGYFSKAPGIIFFPHQKLNNFQNNDQIYFRNEVFPQNLFYIFLMVKSPTSIT